MTATIQPQAKLFEAIPIALSRAESSFDEFYLRIFLSDEIRQRMSQEILDATGKVLVVLQVGSALAQAEILLRIGQNAFVAQKIGEADQAARAAGLY